MAPAGIRKKPAKKRKGGNRAGKKDFLALLRRWSLPILLLLLIGFSLAATFYLVFLHTPASPLF